MKPKLITKPQIMICAYVAVMLFGPAAILGKCSAETAHAGIRKTAAEYAPATPETTDNTAELIAAADARAIADVIEAEKQYEQMDYRFFNGDAEAYPNGK